MSNHRMSTPEASKALGIPVHVITYWLGQIPYPAEQDEQGQWRLTPAAMAVLQTVKDLKEQNHSMETIRRHVKELQDSPPPAARRSATPKTVVAVESTGAPPTPRTQEPTPHTQDPAPRTQGPAPRAPGPAPRSAEPATGAPGRPAGAEARAKPSDPAPGKAAPGPAAGKRSEGGTAPQAPPQARPPASDARPSAAVARPPASQAPVPVAQAPLPVNVGHDLASHVARAVSEAVRQETMLAQRYAHAAHQIGKLEAENEHLRSMLSAAQLKHARDLDDARCRVAELEARPAPKPKTAWWAWLTIGVML